MKGFKLASFALVAVALYSVAAQDGCTIDTVTDARLATLLTTGLGLDEEASVTEVVPICLAAGRIRERFRTITVTVEYNGGMVSTVDLVCDEATNEFILPTSYLGISEVTDSGDQAFLLDPANVVTACDRCIDPVSGIVMFRDADDERRHCISCDDACFFTGLSLCYGSSDTECCNVYLDDVCMNQCPASYDPDASYICQCNIDCMNGGTPNNDCTGCDCLANFRGDSCEECILGNCQTCSQVDGVCLMCYDGFILTTDGRCVIDCTECDLLTDITEQNTCTYFCQLEAWTNEATACGLSVPDVASPNFTVVNETQADLQQLAVDAGEIADGVWAEAATGMFALDAVAPVYGNTAADWQEGIRQYIMNLDVWQRLNSGFPVRDLSSLLDDIGTRPDNEIYDELQDLWVLITNDFTNLIALDQCPV